MEIITIQSIDKIDDTAVYVDLLSGRFSPTERIKAMRYFAFEANYSKEDVENAYRERLKILIDQNNEFKTKLKQATKMFILTLNGQPTLYSDIFKEEIKKYLEWFSRYFALYIVTQYKHRSYNQSFYQYHYQQALVIRKDQLHIRKRLGMAVTYPAHHRSKRIHHQSLHPYQLFQL